jgi:hypothetical protein
VVSSTWRIGFSVELDALAMTVGDPNIAPSGSS